jgi:hypothetical protein
MLLIVMILLSLFTGMSINRNWFFIFQFEFIDYPDIIKAGHSNMRDNLLWGILLLAHFGIFSLPFLTKVVYFKKLLLWFPIIYLLGYVFLRAEFIILLIPFIILWVITLRLRIKQNKKVSIVE